MEKRHKISEELRGETSAISNWIFFLPRQRRRAFFHTVWHALFGGVGDFAVVSGGFKMCRATLRRSLRGVRHIFCRIPAEPLFRACRAPRRASLEGEARLRAFGNIARRNFPAHFHRVQAGTVFVSAQAHRRGFRGRKGRGRRVARGLPPIVCFFATFIYFLERSFRFGGFENIGGGFSSGRIFGLSHVEIAMAALSAAIAGSAFIGAMQNAMKMENPQNR